MKALETYFGLTFTAEVPFDSTRRYGIAKLLFANPKTKTAEAIAFIKEPAIWMDIDRYMKSIEAEIEKIALIDPEDFHGINVGKLFFDKLSAWLQEFSCPTLEEINEVAKLFPLLPKNFMLDQILIIVMDDQMPIQKIVEYLINYISVLSVDTTDYLLDMYKLKSAKSCKLIQF